MTSPCLLDGYPERYVVLIDGAGALLDGHAFVEYTDDTTAAAMKFGCKIVRCESDPEEVLEDYRDAEEGGPVVNHFKCDPSMHSRDISADNARQQAWRWETLPNKRRIRVMRCNDPHYSYGPGKDHPRQNVIIPGSGKNVDLAYCDRAEWYFHVGDPARVDACFMVGTPGWDLSTAGWKLEDGAREPGSK